MVLGALAGGVCASTEEDSSRNPSEKIRIGVAQRFSAAIRGLYLVAASAAEVPLGLKPIPSVSSVAGLKGLRHPKSGATLSFPVACSAEPLDHAERAGVS